MIDRIELNKDLNKVITVADISNSSTSNLAVRIRDMYGPDASSFCYNNNINTAVFKLDYRDPADQTAAEGDARGNEYETDFKIRFDSNSPGWVGGNPNRVISRKHLFPVGPNGLFTHISQNLSSMTLDISKTWGFTIIEKDGYYPGEYDPSSSTGDLRLSLFRCSTYNVNLNGSLSSVNIQSEYKVKTVPSSSGNAILINCQISVPKANLTNHNSLMGDGFGFSTQAGTGLFNIEIPFANIAWKNKTWSNVVWRYTWGKDTAYTAYYKQYETDGLYQVGISGSYKITTAGVNDYNKNGNPDIGDNLYFVTPAINYGGTLCIKNNNTYYELGTLHLYLKFKFILIISD